MKIKKYTDSELISMIRQGGRATDLAIDYLFRLEKRTGSIRKLITRASGSHQDYEEIFDDALVALYSCILNGRYREETKISAYLYGAAQKLQYKRWKKEENRKTVQLDAMNENNITIDDIIDDDRRALLLSMMDGIGQRCKEILVKSHIEGYKNSELAEMFAYKNESVARKTKCNCMKKLVNLVNEHPELLKTLI